MKKSKFYVVFKGSTVGIFDDYNKAQEAVSGCYKGQWLGFKSEEEAIFASKMSYEEYYKNYRSKKIIGSARKSTPLF